MKRLAGKTVLFIAPSFFGYEEEIANELQLEGAVVDQLRDRPYASPAMTAVTRFVPGIIGRIATHGYREKLASFGRSHYDYILVINGQTLSGSFVMELRRQFPRALAVFYMWDSLDNRRSALGNLRLADRALTFDPLDARRHGLILRPLFFSRHLANLKDDMQDIDISFVGTAHTDRAATVLAVDRALPDEVSRFWYLYLQAPWVYYFRKLWDPRMSNVSKTDLLFKPIPKAKLTSIFMRSRAVLDVEHARQRGLTMRTLETIGAGRKLLTTNRGIEDYPFFDPVNIRVIDRKQPAAVDREFFTEPFRPLPAAMYRSLSITGWLEEVLDLASPFSGNPTQSSTGQGIDQVQDI